MLEFYIYWVLMCIFFFFLNFSKKQLFVQVRHIPLLEHDIKLQNIRYQIKYRKLSNISTSPFFNFLQNIQFAIFFWLCLLIILSCCTFFKRIASESKIIYELLLFIIFSFTLNSDCLLHVRTQCCHFLLNLAIEASIKIV